MEAARGSAVSGFTARACQEAEQKYTQNIGLAALARLHLPLAPPPAQAALKAPPPPPPAAGAAVPAPITRVEVLKLLSRVWAGIVF